MSATLLMMSHRPLHPSYQKEKKEDKGTCFNCIYQGEGSAKCKTCKRAYQWRFYTPPKDLVDNFK